VEGLLVSEDLLGAALQAVLRELAQGDIRRHPQDLVRLPVGTDDGALDGLQPAELAGGVGDGFEGNEFFLMLVQHLQVVVPEVLHFLRLGVEVGVRLPQERLHGGPVGLRHRLVGQREPALPILGEDEARIQIQDLIYFTVCFIHLEKQRPEVFRQPVRIDPQSPQLILETVMHARAHPPCPRR
jgi:hypothetical protein